MNNILKPYAADKNNENWDKIIRREKEWEKRLVDKMKMYKEFYDNFEPGDSGYNSLPQLIIVCEDDRHTVEVFREIVKNQIEFQSSS